ncbi:MAG TPA: DUF3810 domain-containing protein [Flavipsychrobacter sp.]|jgi:hypothetical protein|nr:DUF3810 domain-containing protein [Flavipsychrobacter sp.]
MRYKKKLIIILVLVVVLTIIQYALPAHSKVVRFYDNFIFHPFQSIRNIVFSTIPFSVGDILYVLAALALVYVVLKWMFYLIKFRTYKQHLVHSMLQTLIVLGSVYILFILGWGGNYYKPSLTTYWQLDKSHWRKDETLEEFDKYLIAKLNDYAPGYKPVSFKKIDKEAQVYYKEYTDSRTRNYGVKVKPSVFGYLMQHLGIQGYYNPWTGEAQVNKFLPAFMLPFVICHEMAHQSGIAAEDDANLLSYAISIVPKDSVFRYSAYFNLWLYTHARLRMFDTIRANELKQTLNTTTLAHLDTLRKIRRRYNSEISDYSGALYDGYLKLHHQKDGIESYNKVAITAWALEQKERKEKVRDTVIKIP